MQKGRHLGLLAGLSGQTGDEGRGARNNMTGRYESQSRVLVDDGWGTLDEEPPMSAEAISGS